MSSATGDAMEIERLISRARDGDGPALGHLLEQFRSLLRARARISLDTRWQARGDESDLAQVTLTTASTQFAGFHGATEAELTGWLQAILQQHLAAMVRKHVATQKRTVRVEQRQPDVEHSAHAWEAVSPLPSPSRIAIHQEVRQQIETALETLPWEQRETMRLRFIDDWSTAQIAEFMGKSERAVAGLLRRGMSRLKVILDGMQ